MSELLYKFFWIHADNILGEDGSAVVGTQNNHSVEEWLVTELLEQGGFRVSNLLSGCADLVLLGDLDLSLFDLGGDLQSVEEVDLRWIKTSGSWLDNEVDGGDGADLGFSGQLTLFNLSLQVEDWLVGEDQSNLFLQVWQQGSEFWFRGTELFKQLVIFLVRVQRLGTKIDDFGQECLR